MNPKVSIIVPVYNTAEYLSKCLDSLLNQTLKDIEIIVVDDGSKDNSAEIIKKYLQEDCRVKYFLKENGGLSSARNYGIQKSAGEYIGFVDSDDWIEADMFKILYQGAKENNCDSSICGIKYIFEDDTEINKDLNIKKEEVVTGFDAFKKMLVGTEYKCHAVNKLYKRELFGADIKFPEGKLFEDVATTYKLILKADKVYLSNKKYYNYLQKRSGSILFNSFNDRLFDLLDYVNEIHFSLLSNHKFDEVSEEFQCFYIENFIGVSNYLSAVYKNLSKNERDRYKDKLYSYNLHDITKDYLKNSKINNISKMKIMLIRKNFKLFILVNSTLRKYLKK